MIMRKNVHHDLWIGSLMCLGAVVLLLRTRVMPSGAAQFPKVILGCFIAFGLWIVYKGIVKTLLLRKGLDEKVKDKPLKLMQMARPMACLLGVIAYVAIIKITGFFVASTIFSLVFMWLYGLRSVKKMLVITFGMDVFLYVLFVMQLKVQLPEGMLNLM